MMARCCLPHFDIERESPAAPSKSQHCWQPKSGAAHSPGKKICEKGAELSLPMCFLFSLHLFLHLLFVYLCQKIHVWVPRTEKDFPFPFPTSPPSREDICKYLSIFLQRAFLQLLAFPCCPSLLFWMNYMVSSVHSSHPCSTPALQCAGDAQWRGKSAERRGTTGY